MTFEEILDQAIAMLQRRGRLTYGALKRQFQLDDAYLEDLKAKLIEGQRLAVDEEGRVLVWRGEPVSAPPLTTASPSTRASEPERMSLAYTLAHLADDLGMRPLVAHCHLGLGTLHSRIGRVDQARTDLAAAIALYRDMDMTFWLPQTEAALAQVEGR
jgi:hypothetical protein